MRAFFSQETDAIDTDDEFANLVNFSRRRGRYTYEFAVQVDQIRALKLRATRLRITVKYPDNSKRTSVFGGGGQLSPQQAVDAILIDKPTSKDKIRAKRRYIISRRSMDITSRLSNEVARYVDRFTEEESLTLLPKVRTYEFKTVQQLIDEREETSYNNQVFLEEDFGDVDDENAAAAALESINSLSRDPAKAVMSRFKIRTQDDALMGTIPSSETILDQKKDKIIRTLRKDFTSITNSQPLESLDANDLIPVLVRRPKRFITIRRRMNIHRRHFRRAKRFEVVIELLDREGAIVQREIHRVNHAAKARDYYIPRRAPLIRYVGSDLGENVLEIMQRDKKCNAIELYRRIINDSERLNNEKWELVGRYTSRKRGRRRRVGRRWRRIIDSVQNTNPIIYRVIPVRGRRKGVGFRSIVAPPVKIQSESIVVRNKNCSLFLHSSEEGVVIEARNYDQTADFMSIHRRDITAKEKSFKILSREVSEVDATPTAYKQLTGGAMVLTDKSVKDGRIYEYFVEILYKDGTSFRAIGSDFVEYQKPDNEIEFEVRNQRVTTDRDSPDFSMNIVHKSGQSRGRVNTSEMLKNHQARRGLSSVYKEADQEEEKRDLTEQLTVFLITRHNLTTGQKEEFNVFDPAASTRFVDSRNGRSSRVSALESGCEYRYVIIGCELPLGALYRRAKITRRDRRTGRKFRRSLAKTRSRRGLRRGVLLPRRGRTRSAGKNAIFHASKTGSMQVVSVDLRDTRPIIERGDIDKLNDYENKISWSIEGESDMIDHFVISIELRNCSIPILTAMCLPGRSKYQLIDRYTPRIRGPVEFKITPVYLDFTKGDDYDLGAVISSGIANKRRRQGRRR